MKRARKKKKKRAWIVKRSKREKEWNLYTDNRGIVLASLRRCR